MLRQNDVDWGQVTMMDVDWRIGKPAFRIRFGSYPLDLK